MPQHDRLLRWVEVEPDDVDQFLDEPWVVADFERVEAGRCRPSLYQMRCTVAGLTPTRSAMVRHDQWVWPFRLLLRGQPDDLGDLLIGDRGLPATTLLDPPPLGQPFQRTRYARPALSPP